MIAFLPESVSSMLRYHRHELAGRIHVLLATIELAASEVEHHGGGVGDALNLLRDLERAWRSDLARCDMLLGGEPMPYPVASRALTEILGTVVPDGIYLCDADALARSVRHGHKAIGRASLYAHTTRVATESDGLVVELRAGASTSTPDRPVYEAMAGDGDAFLCHAESRLAGVDLFAVRDDDGVVLSYFIPYEVPRTD
jgi:hypothetical protein